jgi:hypothetical protein
MIIILQQNDGHTYSAEIPDARAFPKFVKYNDKIFVNDHNTRPEYQEVEYIQARKIEE